MPEQLFIRLFGERDATWLVMDADGQIVGLPEFGDLQEAATLAVGRHVVVIVPGDEVTLSHTSLPTRNRQKMLQAVPFIMEDQLIDDVQDMHFALGNHAADNQINVAVVSRKLMRNWTGVMENAGIRPHALVPDTLSVPVLNGNWGVLIDGDRALVRTGGQSGFVTERDNLNVMLPRAIKELETGPDSVDVIDCGKGKPTDAASLGVDADVIYEKCEHGALTVLARHYHADTSINLLQGEFSRNEQIGKKWKPWLPAAVMAGLLILLQLGQNITEYVSLSRSKARLGAQIEEIFKSTFPGKSIKDAVAQTRIELRTMQNSSGGGYVDFLDMLADIAPVLKQAENLQLERLHFKDGRLDLQLQLPDLQHVDSLMNKLNVLKQYQVDQPTVSNKGQLADVRLKIQQAP